MKILKITILLFVIILTTRSTFAQASASCKNFAKTGFEILDTAVFTHDGRYNALKLSEGDKIDVYKPFYKGRTYKIVVLSEENMPELTFKVINIQRQTLFESDNLENAQFWEYTPDKNENLIITVEIPGAEGDKIESGCVAVIVGYKTS
jgi:hypothetical protein